MSAPADAVARRIEAEPAGTYEVRPLNYAAVTEWMGALDEEVLGFRRDAYHGFLQQSAPTEAMTITRDGEPVGVLLHSEVLVTSVRRPKSRPVANGRYAVGAAVRRAPSPP